MAATASAAGHVTYTYNDQVYRIQALEGATPENISLALETLSPLPAGSRESGLNISPDGKWLILETGRFDEECADWDCLAVVASDLSSGGNLVIFTNGGGTHERDLWAMKRSSIGADWEAPVEQCMELFT